LTVDPILYYHTIPRVSPQPGNKITTHYVRTIISTSHPPTHCLFSLTSAFRGQWSLMSSSRGEVNNQKAQENRDGQPSHRRDSIVTAGSYIARLFSKGRESAYSYREFIHRSALNIISREVDSESTPFIRCRRRRGYDAEALKDLNHGDFVRLA